MRLARYITQCMLQASLILKIMSVILLALFTLSWFLGIGSGSEPLGHIVLASIIMFSLFFGVIAIVVCIEASGDRVFANLHPEASQLIMMVLCRGSLLYGMFVCTEKIIKLWH